MNDRHHTPLPRAYRLPNDWALLWREDLPYPIGAISTRGHFYEKAREEPTWNAAVLPWLRIMVPSSSDTEEWFISLLADGQDPLESITGMVDLYRRVMVILRQYKAKETGVFTALHEIHETLHQVQEPHELLMWLRDEPLDEVMDPSNYLNMLRQALPIVNSQLMSGLCDDLLNLYKGTEA